MKLCLTMALLVSCSVQGEETVMVEFYVARDGCDTNSGTKEKPFATLERARDAVRALKAGGLKKDILVQVRGGTYFLKEPLVFEPEDSGTQEHSITYAAASGEKPVLSGGRPITGWKKGEGNLWTVELPEVKAGKWYFRQLFVNGRRATRARGPNDGFFRVVKAGPDNRTSFTFKKGDLRAFRNIADAEIVYLHDWSVSRMRLKSVDEAASLVTFAGPIGWSCDMGRICFWPNPRYYIENAPDLLDKPGEWYLDRTTGVLDYWPLPGEDMAGAEAVAPRLESLLRVKGEATRPVENLKVEGLTFAHAEWQLPEHGMLEVQAGVYHTGNSGKPQVHVAIAPVAKDQIHLATAAVTLEGSRGCVVEGGRVDHAGGVGIRISGLARENRVIGCEVGDIGFNGIMVGSTQNDPAELARGNVVADNLVHHCGVIAHGSVGVWSGMTEGTVITHNEIRELPYTGISLGWIWEGVPPSPTQCKGNIVENNHIHHVMQVLSDGGGIYTLGCQPGSALRGNLIHDIPANAGFAEGNGIFLDNISSEFVVEGNTIYGLARRPIRLAGEAASIGRISFQDNATPAMPRVSVLTPGKVGRALACNGTDSYEESPHAPELEPEQLTVEAWVRPQESPSGGNGRRWVFNKNANDWQQGHYALVVEGRKAGAYLNIGGGQANCFDTWSREEAIKPDTWHHLAMTYDGRMLTVHLDGKQMAAREVNKARQPGNAPLRIGGRQDGFSDEFTLGFFRGAIDEVRLYKRALSADEIKTHFEAPDKVAKDEALIRHWGFDETGEAGDPDWLKKARETTGPRPPWRERLAERDR